MQIFGQILVWFAKIEHGGKPQPSRMAANVLFEYFV